MLMMLEDQVYNFADTPTFEKGSVSTPQYTHRVRPLVQANTTGSTPAQPHTTPQQQQSQPLYHFRPACAAVVVCHIRQPTLTRFHISLMCVVVPTSVTTMTSVEAAWVSVKPR